MRTVKALKTLWQIPVTQFCMIIYINSAAYFIMRYFISEHQLLSMLTDWFHSMYFIAIPYGLYLKRRKK